MLKVVMAIQKTYRNRAKSNSRKALYLLLVAVLLIATVSAAYLFLKHNDKPGFSKTTTGHDVNLQPPTPEEKQETDEHKDSLAEKDAVPTPPPPSPDGLKQVTPFITFAGQEGGDVSISGYVPSIFEEGGTCTATFSNGSNTHSQQSKGFSDFKQTTCTPMTVPRTSFTTAGTWNVVLSYSSKSATGSSQPRSFTIE